MRRNKDARNEFGETLEGQADLARALIEGGEKKQGLLILHRLESEVKHRYVSPVDLAGIYTMLGDHEKAMTLLENAFRAAQWKVAVHPSVSRI